MQPTKTTQNHAKLVKTTQNQSLPTKMIHIHPKPVTSTQNPLKSTQN